MKAKTADILQQGMTLPLHPSAVIADGVVVAAALDRAGFAALIEAALETLRRKVIAGDAPSGVALSLLPENPGRFVPALAERLAVAAPDGAERPRAPGAAFYEGAVDAAAEGRSEEALILLAALLADGEARLDGLLGLAVLAMRMEAHDAALALAQESLQFSVKHPRACCIAGLCELERGDRKAAQTYFAAAARIARSRPEFREDLQTAQRALLMMHLA